MCNTMHVSVHPQAAAAATRILSIIIMTEDNDDRISFTAAVGDGNDTDYDVRDIGR